MTRNALTIRTDDGDCLPPRLPINRDSLLGVGRHLFLYLSLSWLQVVPWESDGEGSYRSHHDHGLLCILPRTPAPICILISAPNMHAAP